MRSLLSTWSARSLILGLAWAVWPSGQVQAQTSYLAFDLLLNGSAGGPTFSITNRSRDIQITNLLIAIAPVWTFDAVYNFNNPPGGSASEATVDTDSVGGTSSSFLNIRLTGFDPGEGLSFSTDLDILGQETSFADYRTSFFNNGSLPNMTIAAYGNGVSATLTLSDPASSSLSAYFFSLPRPSRTLTLESVTESDLPVRAVTIVTNGLPYLIPTLNPPTNGVVGERVSLILSDGDTVEIQAPREVYKNMFGVDITDSVETDPAQIEVAQERFTASGITVNNQLQTGDPTLYRFEITQNTVIQVSWRHAYALVIDHDFTLTESLDRDALGEPWAGPLTSKAVGNPEPEARKHWIDKDQSLTVFIDGQVADFSRPGLDVRYVPVGFEAFGPPNRNVNAAQNELARMSNTDISTNSSYLQTFMFPSTQMPPLRLQVPPSDIPDQPSSFVMSGPGGVRFIWQIQFGVKMNVDDPSRNSLPRVFQTINSTNAEVGALEGTFWFNPGTEITVAIPANETTQPGSEALAGWFSGDGYYFSSSGSIDTTDGSLAQGGPGLKADGNPAAFWVSSFVDNNGREYRGLRIPNLQRAARVLWRYSGQQVKVQATIGEYVFQGDARESLYINEPQLITQVVVNGQNKQVAANDMAVWDPVASRLYPLVPGVFRATWQPIDSPTPLEVIVTVLYPDTPHYPHIADTPPVALDPDPADTFVFKELRYTENQASVDNAKRFTASLPGNSVLVFSEIQTVGRGQPREFTRVRVVTTRRWNDQLPSSGSAVIGTKISDPGLDKANLGTGFVMFQNARFNPFIYDASKLEGLGANAVYDMAALRSSAASKIVTQPGNLPGPIIPVNVHPGAANTQRVVVVWYDDPARHDLLLWPHKARAYLPRWPTGPEEGLGRIVIASQHGSESLGTNGLDQPVAPEVIRILSGPTGPVTNIAPAETTYNPTRLQQVQVYVQPDPAQPGYNPNEEHALMAPSLRFAQVSPRPPAAYALRDNDLNKYNRLNTTFDERLENPATFTSHPFVLVQFFDVVLNEYKMRVYRVERDDPDIPNYGFADPNRLTAATEPRLLQQQPHLRMLAGEPVIPFYPLVEVIGASPCAESFGINLKAQTVYWEDHKGTSWSVSGGTNAWFTGSFYYPLLPSFWWPPNQPGFIQELVENDFTVRRARVPQTGDCVAFVPNDINTLLGFAEDSLLPVTGPFDTEAKPVRVLYKSDWPDVAPVLKAGETLTFQGGEFRADRPFIQVANQEGELETVETPGLPGIVGFASAEVVFDSLNETGDIALWRSQWTARVAQVLDRRSVPMTLGQFPPELQPATKRTRVKEGKYVFNELPASLQNRIRFDPLAGRLEVSGLLNDKDIGDSTLTASPPAVYILEPNIITEEEGEALLALSEDANWRSAVAQLIILSRNPSLIDSDNATLGPLSGSGDRSSSTYRNELEEFWTDYYQEIGVLPPGSLVPLPVPITDADVGYLVGLEPAALYDSTGHAVTIDDPVFIGFKRPVTDVRLAVPVRAFGPGLALLPNPGFLDPTANLPDVSWVSVVENNDPSLGGSPITIHVIQVMRDVRYRGAIKTAQSDNVFDENLGLRHTGDFGANADELFFEWWYRPDDGSLNVPPPDLLLPSQSNPWKLFPDPTGKRGKGRYQVTLKGNPNAPEALLADTFWFVRYRHEHDLTAGTNWKVPQPNGDSQVNFTWAGAGNSDPFNDLDADGLPDYRAQLAQGWIKRVLDAVNPYEARIRDFEGDNPSTVTSMIQQFGARFEGPVALNPAKNVIENVGLIELYETILDRGRNLSIDLSRPVSTPAIANALQLASTRISDFYTLLGNEAYADALDPTTGAGQIFAFENQVASVLEEELGLLRGVDDFFARPVYNRLFWNFTKAEGEAAYVKTYNITDINMDGFIDEDDAMILYPQGHGDAWGHYLTALRNQYELLRHPFFNWVSRSEFYNLQDIVIKVDFLDERKFAQTAAQKAKAGAEIVDLTYRQQFVIDPAAQWQGYGDANEDRSWGVEQWARRAGQGAYFDWVTANALLPSVHPNGQLVGIQKVDRQSNSDITVISANLNAIQSTIDQSNKGQNPLGLDDDALVFDIDPTFLEVGSVAQIGTRPVQGLLHFDQIYERARKMLEHASAVWNNANESRNMLRAVGNSEAEFRNSVFQEDLSYKNQLIAIFGKPYDGTVGPGRVYPAGYDGPDLLLWMYVDVRTIDNTTVPGPTTTFASFDENGDLENSEIYRAFVNGEGAGGAPRGQLAHINSVTPELQTYLSVATRQLFSPTFTLDSSGDAPARAQDGLYAVNYTDLTNPKVPLENLTQLMPVTAAGYTFQAPAEWGTRPVAGELQQLISQMIQQEAAIALAIGAWDSLQGAIVREIRNINAKVDMQANIRLKNELFGRLKNIIENIIKGVEGAKEISDTIGESVELTIAGTIDGVPSNLPIAGLAVGPGDALSALRAGFGITKTVTHTTWRSTSTVLKILKLATEISLSVAENELDLFEKREEDALAVKEMLKELENLVGDEPIKRIAVFKEIQALRQLSDQFRSKVDQGRRLIDERTAFNKRVAAQTQRNRYQDMTLRITRNHALQNYRATFDLAARYIYLAAKAYDYETNFDPLDPRSPSSILTDIVKARRIGLFDGEPRLADSGLSTALARLKENYEVLKGQLGLNNPEIEIGKMSLRTENFRILPKAEAEDGGQEPPPATQPSEFPFPGMDANQAWRDTLEAARVEDLWLVPEYRYYCRPFAAEAGADGSHVPEPGLVLRFGSEVTAGKNYFGHPLAGGDHIYDPSHFATKIQSVGIWFSDYLSGDPLNDLPATPRVYLVPVGADIMSVPNSSDPGIVRVWKVLDQSIPVPLPASTAALETTPYIPLFDSLNGRISTPRKFSMFRAYHDGGNAVNDDELVFDTRLVARSVWNTQWLLIIPGRMLNADPQVGIQRFIDQVTDIKLVFRTYGLSGG